jgi:menaquinone-dependent protoporphyrinogen oxidase
MNAFGDCMMRILIIYDTTEGQTRKIAQRMADAIHEAGHDTEVVDLRRLPDGFSSDGFDAIIAGASIHLGKHSRQLTAFVSRHVARLNAVPSGFFSVSLSAAGSEKERADASRFVEEVLAQTGWSPAINATFAGGLLYREYGFLKRWMMKKIAREAGKDTDTSKNHEYTDWAAVDQFVDGVLAHLHQQRTGSEHG